MLTLLLILCLVFEGPIFNAYHIFFTPPLLLISHLFFIADNANVLSWGGCVVEIKKIFIKSKYGNTKYFQFAPNGKMVLKA